MSFNSKIDKKFEDENYIPTINDIKDFNDEQAKELYTIARLDFDAYDDLRSYDISCNRWTDENESAWFNAHKRYIITRKLLTQFCNLNFNCDYHDYTNYDDFEACDDTTKLYAIRKNLQKDFYYSRVYDSIQSFIWSDEYQNEYNKLKDKLIKINIKIHKLEADV